MWSLVFRQNTNVLRNVVLGYSRTFSTSEPIAKLKPISEFESCHDFLIGNIENTPPIMDWNHIIDELIGTDRPIYSESFIADKSKAANIQMKYGQVSKNTGFHYKEMFRRSLNDSNLDMFIFNACKRVKALDQALSYRKFMIRDNRRVTLQHQLAILQLAATKQVAESEEKEVIELADSFLESIKGHEVHDSHAAYAIAALTNTREWERAFQLFKNIKLENDSCDEELEDGFSKATVLASSNFILRLMRNDQLEEMWKLMNTRLFLSWHFPLRNRVFQQVQDTQDGVYEAYIDRCNTYQDLEKLFVFFANNDVLISWELVRKLKSFCDDVLKLPKTSIAELRRGGYCRFCDSTLREETWTKEHCDFLMNQVFSKCLAKDNVYESSHPKEIKRFNQFLANSDKFDVVVDGLNVSLSSANVAFNRENTTLTYQQHNDRQSENLLNYVKKLKEKGYKKILVIHRVYVRQYKDYPEIKSYADIYATERHTHDDQFAIVAALNSGPGTMMLSNDRFRQHNSLLKTYQLQKMFTEWQIRHQIFHQNWRKPLKAPSAVRHRLPQPVFNVSDPITHPIKVQKSKNAWHLPIIPSLNKDKPHLAVPKQWLCIKIQ